MDKPRFAIIRDIYGNAYSIDKDEYTLMHVYPSERTEENINEIVRLLNVADEVERKEKK